MVWCLFLPSTHLHFSWSFAPLLSVGIPVFRYMVSRDTVDLEVKVAAPQLSYLGSTQLCSTVFFFLPSAPLFLCPSDPRAALLEPASLLRCFLSLPPSDLWDTSSSSAMVSQACHRHLTWAGTDMILDRHFQIRHSPSPLEEQYKVWLGALKLAALHLSLACPPVC